NVGMFEHAAQQFLEPRVGQSALGAPPSQRSNHHAAPELTWPMDPNGGLLQPQRVDSISTSVRARLVHGRPCRSNRSELVRIEVWCTTIPSAAQRLRRPGRRTI